MTVKTFDTIYKLLEAEISLAEDSIRMFTKSNEMLDVDYWNRRRYAAIEAASEFNMQQPEDYQLWKKAEELKQMLLESKDYNEKSLVGAALIQAINELSYII